VEANTTLGNQKAKRQAVLLKGEKGNRKKKPSISKKNRSTISKGEGSTGGFLLTAPVRGSLLLLGSRCRMGRKAREGEGRRSREKRGETSLQRAISRGPSQKKIKDVSTKKD